MDVKTQENTAMDTVRTISQIEVISHDYRKTFPTILLANEVGEGHVDTLLLRQDEEVHYYTSIVNNTLPAH